MLAKNSGKAWDWCSNCIHTLQYLVVPVEWGSALPVLHAACCCLICHPFPFIWDCAWEAGRLFAPLSVASVIFFIIAYCQNVVSPYTSLLPVSPWNLCWKMKANPSFLATEKAEGLFWHVHGPWRHRDHTGDEEVNIWAERSHLFLWLEYSLPSCGLWEVYLLKEHLSSCLSKPPTTWMHLWPTPAHYY